MAANPYRGELAVTVDGRSYTLRPSFNAICQLEEVTGKAFDEILGSIRAGRMSGLRAVVFALLQDKHGAEIVELADAGNWIEALGGPSEALEATYKVFGMNLEQTLERAGELSANPPAAPAGISPGYWPTHDGSVSARTNSGG